MTEQSRTASSRKSIHAETCFAESFIGADFEVNQDLTNELTENWRDFNAKFRDIFKSNHPDKTNVGAGLACGFLWTVSKGIKIGDIVLCPDGTGTYHIGEISSNYFYHPGGPYPKIRIFHITNAINLLNWLNLLVIRRL